VLDEAAKGSDVGLVTGRTAFPRFLARPARRADEAPHRLRAEIPKGRVHYETDDVADALVWHIEAGNVA
jgi:hypothetical protein